jgi:hypothetical protein
VVTPDELTTIELLVLSEAGGENDLSNAYGAIQLYSHFERREELIEATEGAVLRLFDLGLIRAVEARPEVGYRTEHSELPALVREELVAVFGRHRNPLDVERDTLIFFDPTPDGEALLDAIAPEQIPRVSGTVRRPWLEQMSSLRRSDE